MLPSFYSIGNPDITWETNTNMNIGLEFNLFRNRLNGEVNFYNRKTTNLLNWMSIPESYGARGYYGNMGDIRNRGWEIILSGDIIRTKHVVWSGSFNIAFNSTKILSLPETKTANYGGYAESNDDDMRNWYTVGGPLYNAMMPEYAGVNDQGEALYWIDDDLYQKYAVEGKQTAQSQPGTKHSRTTTNWSEATYYTQGSTLPKANGGFSSTVNAYGFDATVTFDYRLGGKIYDYTYASLMENVSTTGNGFALHKDILKSWTPDNTSSNIPRFMYGDLYTTSTSTRFLTSARYLNFQSFVVGYTLPADLTRRFLVSKMRIYVQGENLCYWSARKGLDPRYSYRLYGWSVRRPCLCAYSYHHGWCSNHILRLYLNRIKHEKDNFKFPARCSRCVHTDRLYRGSHPTEPRWCRPTRLPTRRDRLTTSWATLPTILRVSSSTAPHPMSFLMTTATPLSSSPVTWKVRTS